METFIDATGRRNRIRDYGTNLLLPLVCYIRCVHYGVLPEDEAKQVYKKMLARKGTKGTVSSPAAKKSSKKAKIEKDVGVEADLQISGTERVGSSSMVF